MRVLVTGSAGRIGGELVSALREAGHEIRTFDRSAQPRGSDWDHVPGDLRDLDAVRSVVHGVDAVAHLGAIPGDRRDAADQVFAVNVMGTLHVLMACAEAGVGRVVYMSSVNALGNFNGHRPAAWLPIDDSYPRHPMSPYQLSKHLAEEACRSFTNRHGMVTVSLRPVYVSSPDHYARWGHYGPERRAEWGKADYWSYVDLRDVCEAVLLALTTEGISHDAFLLAAADTTSAVPTAELVDAHYPDTPWPRVDRAAYLADCPHRSLVDCRHAREVLGWEPRHGWREEAGGEAMRR